MTPPGNVAPGVAGSGREGEHAFGSVERMLDVIGAVMGEFEHGEIVGRSVVGARRGVVARGRGVVHARGYPRSSDAKPTGT